MLTPKRSQDVGGHRLNAQTHAIHAGVTVRSYERPRDVVGVAFNGYLGAFDLGHRGENPPQELGRDQRWRTSTNENRYGRRQTGFHRLLNLYGQSRHVVDDQ